MDMIETPLRSIIISEIWKSMMTPTYSTMNLVIMWTINACSYFLLSCDIIICLRSDHLVSTIPSSISFLTSHFTCFVIRHSCDLVTCLQAVSMQYHREGPENIFPSSGQKNSTLDPWTSTNTFKILFRYSYGVTFDIIKVLFWYQCLTWSHGLRIRTTSYEFDIAMKLDYLIILLFVLWVWVFIT
jgi:hypothetical protein